MPMQRPHTASGEKSDDPTTFPFLAFRPDCDCDSPSHIRPNKARTQIETQPGEGRRRSAVPPCEPAGASGAKRARPFSLGRRIRRRRPCVSRVAPRARRGFSIPRLRGRCGVPPGGESHVRSDSAPEYAGHRAGAFLARPPALRWREAKKGMRRERARRSEDTSWGDQMFLRRGHEPIATSLAFDIKCP